MGTNRIERTFRLEKGVPRSYLAASWYLWQVGKPVTVKSLTALLETQKEKIDSKAVSVTVDIARFLNAVCP